MSSDNRASGRAAHERNPLAVSAVPVDIPDAKRSRAFYEDEALPPVEHRQAEDAATDLINHYFKNEPRHGGGVRIGVPARPTQDTDLLLHRYIREMERLERAFRISIWNSAKSAGMSDRLAMRKVEKTVADAKAPPEKAIEVRRAETGTGSVHESAVGNADLPESDPPTPRPEAGEEVE